MGGYHCAGASFLVNSAGLAAVLLPDDHVRRARRSRPSAGVECHLELGHGGIPQFQFREVPRSVSDASERTTPSSPAIPPVASLEKDPLGALPEESHVIPGKCGGGSSEGGGRCLWLMLLMWLVKRSPSLVLMHLEYPEEHSRSRARRLWRPFSSYACCLAWEYP